MGVSLNLVLLCIFSVTYNHQSVLVSLEMLHLLCDIVLDLKLIGGLSCVSSGILFMIATVDLNVHIASVCGSGTKVV